LLHVRIAGPTAPDGIGLIARLSGMHAFTAGETLRFALDATRVHLFDAAGKAVATHTP
jgi:hypothetical protein